MTIAVNKSTKGNVMKKYHWAVGTVCECLQHGESDIDSNAAILPLLKPSVKAAMEANEDVYLSVGETWQCVCHKNGGSK